MSVVTNCDRIMQKSSGLDRRADVDGVRSAAIELRCLNAVINLRPHMVFFMPPLFIKTKMPVSR